MKRSHLAWGIAALDVVAFLVAFSFAPTGGIGAAVLYVIGIASFTAVGALLWTRVPANPIGVMLLAAGTVLVAAIVVGTYADVGFLQVPPWPGASLARRIGDTTFIYPFVIALIGVPLVFPDGRLPSARFRWVVRITIATMVAWTILGTLLDQEARTTDPVLSALAPLFGAVEGFVLVATLVSFGAAVVAVWLRFRRGDPVQRQQVKWLVAVVGVAALVLPASLVLTDANPELANALSIVGILALFALPIVIAIAILRYRLYDIDRIISRTVSYGAVTGILAVVFVGTILGSQTILASLFRGNSVAVAASTLVVAALFQPLRRRVQSVVDRRFNRSRYDAERTVAAFGERLRDQVDLASLSGEIAGVVDSTLHPSRIGVWLRAPGRDVSHSTTP